MKISGGGIPVSEIPEPEVDEFGNKVVKPIIAAEYKTASCSRAFPCLIESAGFANQLLSDSSYLPMEVGRYVASPFH
ncbi:hypothetical protein L3V16_21170 [Brucella ciceri]|uniref:hypothetical protein n=1 Tax=Brucella ciceri TaxID=391287 RepID=UPI000DE49E6B|nr:MULTISPECIES: hypothetical protein [Brucella]MCH6206338.1 hypothetical protein [Brucella ciceri]